MAASITSLNNRVGPEAFRSIFPHDINQAIHEINLDDRIARLSKDQDRKQAGDENVQSLKWKIYWDLK